jgi:peptide/nickel transport system substrate-binding protein
MSNRSTASRLSAATAVVVVGLAMCVACSSGDAEVGTATTPELEHIIDAGPAQDGGSVEVALGEETAGWNPREALWSNASYSVGFAIFDPLAVYDSDGVPRPYLAKSITSNPELTEWLIDLRDGVRFHDGTPLDAEAVKENLEAARVSIATAASVGLISDVAVDGPLSVRVVMSEPWSTFPHILTGQVGLVASPGMLQDPDGASNPVGTGPFAFEEWEPGAQLVVTKNAAYWQEGLPHLDQITFRIITDEVTQGLALASGDVNLRLTTDAQQIAGAVALAEEGDVQIATTEGIDDLELTLGLNTAVAPFDDPAARQAIDLAIDRAEIAATVYGGVFSAADSPFEPSNPNYVDLAPLRPFDRDRARQLAADYESDHGEPLAFSLLVLPSPGQATLAQFVQQQLAMSGIDMEIEPVEVASGLVAVTTGDFQAFIYELAGGPTLNPEFAVFEAPPLPVGEFTMNLTRHSDPELLAAITRGRSSADVSVQVAATQDVQRRVAEEHTYLFLVHKRTAMVYGPNVHGADQYDFPDGVEGRFGAVNIFFGYLWIEA